MASEEGPLAGVTINATLYVSLLVVSFLLIPLMILVNRKFRLTDKIDIEFLVKKYGFGKLKGFMLQNSGLKRRSLAAMIESYLYAQTNYGLIIDLVQASLSLISCALVLYSASSPLTENEKWSINLEICLTIYFALDYSLRFFLAEDRLQFYFSLLSLLDFITIVPGLLQLLISQSAYDPEASIIVQALRSFRIFRAVRMLRILVLSTSSSLKRQGIVLFVSVICAIFACASLFQILDSLNGEFVEFHRAVMLMTMIVIGRPLVTTHTDFARIFVTMIIITSAFMIPLIMADMLRLLIDNQGQDEFTGSSSTPHVVLCGDINTSRLRAFLAQFFNKSRNPEVLSPLVVLSDQKYEGALKLIIEQSRYSGSVRYIKGSARKPADLKRAAAHRASSVIVLCHTSNDIDASRADAEVLAVCLSVKNINRRVRILAQIRKNKTREQLMCLPGWRKEDRAVAVSSLSMTLVGVGASLPGLPTLLTNLIHQGNKNKVKSLMARRRKVLLKGINEETKGGYALSTSGMLVGSTSSFFASPVGWIARMGAGALYTLQSALSTKSAQEKSQSLVSQFVKEIIRPLSPLEEYTEGFAQELFAFAVTQSLVGITFAAAARSAFLRHGVLFIGVRVPRAGSPAPARVENVTADESFEVLLFPSDLILLEGMYIHAIAYGSADIEQLLVPSEEDIEHSRAQSQSSSQENEGQQLSAAVTTQQRSLRRHNNTASVNISVPWCFTEQEEEFAETVLEIFDSKIHHNDFLSNNGFINHSGGVAGGILSRYTNPSTGGGVKSLPRFIKIHKCSCGSGIHWARSLKAAAMDHVLAKTVNPPNVTAVSHESAPLAPSTRPGRPIAYSEWEADEGLGTVLDSLDDTSTSHGTAIVTANVGVTSSNDRMKRQLSFRPQIGLQRSSSRGSGQLDPHSPTPRQQAALQLRLELSKSLSASLRAHRLRLQESRSLLYPRTRAGGRITSSPFSPYSNHILICGCSDRLGLLLRALQTPLLSSSATSGGTGIGASSEGLCGLTSVGSLQNTPLLRALAPTLNSQDEGSIARRALGLGDIKIVCLSPASSRPTDAAMNSLHPGSSKLVSAVEFVNGVPTDLADLLRAGVETARAALVLATKSLGGDASDSLKDDAEAILVSSALYKLNPRLHVVTEVVHGPHASYLRPCGTSLLDAEDTAKGFVDAIKSAELHRLNMERDSKPQEDTQAENGRRVLLSASSTSLSAESTEKTVQPTTSHSTQQMMRSVPGTPLFSAAIPTATSHDLTTAPLGAVTSGRVSAPVTPSLLARLPQVVEEEVPDMSLSPDGAISTQSSDRLTGVVLQEDHSSVSSEEGIEHTLSRRVDVTEFTDDAFASTDEIFAGGAQTSETEPADADAELEARLARQRIDAALAAGDSIGRTHMGALPVKRASVVGLFDRIAEETDPTSVDVPETISGSAAAVGTGTATAVPSTTFVGNSASGQGSSVVPPSPHLLPDEGTSNSNSNSNNNTTSRHASVSSAGISSSSHFHPTTLYSIDGPLLLDTDGLPVFAANSGEGAGGGAAGVVPSPLVDMNDAEAAVASAAAAAIARARSSAGHVGPNDALSTPADIFGSPSFASGRAFSSTTLDALLCEAHFAPHVLFVIKLLVRASRKRRLLLIPARDAIALAMLVSKEALPLPEPDESDVHLTNPAFQWKNPPRTQPSAPAALSHSNGGVLNLQSNMSVSDDRQHIIVKSEEVSSMWEPIDPSQSAAASTSATSSNNRASVLPSNTNQAQQSVEERARTMEAARSRAPNPPAIVTTGLTASILESSYNAFSGSNGHGDCKSSVEAPVVKTTDGRTVSALPLVHNYGRLFEGLLRGWNYLPLGLYRRVRPGESIKVPLVNDPVSVYLNAVTNGSLSNNGLGNLDSIFENDKSMLSYVYTNPSADTMLNDGDFVFLLKSDDE